MLRKLFSNHVFANLIFVLVLLVGTTVYRELPREEFPDVNFYWVDITTFAPGMTASDVESRVTVVIERAIRNTPDISYATSFSRENVSSLTVRFEDDISERQFDKRVASLRREIQNKRSELPDEIDDPVVTEIDTSTAFAVGTVVVSSEDDGINLLEQAQTIKKDLEAIEGVNLIISSGLHPRELQVRLEPELMEGLGIAPTEVADTVSMYYRDFSAGTNRVGTQAWAVKIDGMQPDAAYLAQLPLLMRANEINIGDVATVIYDHEEPKSLVRMNGKPAVLFGVTKQRGANSLGVIDELKRYIETRNLSSDTSGVVVTLADDQSINTRNAISVMQRNAMLGLFLVLIMTWLFLGPRIAIFTCIGIPFIIAATFWVISLMGFTLNTIVLLGIVISLGMMVDDAVVVIESIYYRLQQGMNRMDASIAALQEVAAPVTTAVLTTIAAFMPLILLEGVMGQFMSNVPWVVTIALLMSLVEAFWMLPVHVMGTQKGYDPNNKMNRWRRRWQRKLRNRYTRALVFVIKRPLLIIISCILLVILAVSSSMLGIINPKLYQHPLAKQLLIKYDFFKTDNYPLFYVGLEMPNGTPLEETLLSTLALEDQLRTVLQDNEISSIVSYAGKMESDNTPLFGNQYGQILVSLKQHLPPDRNAESISNEVREIIDNYANASRTNLLLISMSPPVGKPVSIKVMGDNVGDLRRASDELQAVMAENTALLNITDDDSPGLMELSIQMNTDTIQRAGLNPLFVARNIRMLVDGEIVAAMQFRGEELNVRVLPDNDNLEEIDQILDNTLPTPNGPVTIRSLTDVERGAGMNDIRRHKFRRAITVESDIDVSQIDTIAANNFINQRWQDIKDSHPGVSISQEGQVDDIVESLNSLGGLFLFGLLLMYLIIGTQFQSYFQPFMIIATVPLALIGVVLGQLVSGNSISMFSLVGIVALAGMAVNAAIVMISAANDRLRQGMSVAHAAIYAGRRRVMPIIITSFTTMAGLFSLAAGIGGKSLMWGPLANAIVWGVMISSTLTLFLMPVIYMIFMPYSNIHTRRQHTAFEKLFKPLLNYSARGE